MKHAYKPDCTCTRCTREASRRNSQSRANTARKVWPAVRYRGRKVSKRPAPGSAEWAETYADDLGESPDY